MANQVENPFENEKPQLVHFEKNESHYEYCRMQMHEINRVHKRTFLCNMVLCMAVCLLAVFKEYIAGFDLLSKPFAGVDNPGAILAGGIFQIIIAMFVILVGYLAWANFRTLNILLTGWYLIVAIIGIARGDYLSALIGVVGIVFYFFSLREMQHEESLSQMEGYPEFQEKFDISKSDIVIQTLLAHKGEHRTKSTLFTTDYSLRRKKKKSIPGVPDTEEPDAASAALAEELKKHLDETKEARSAEEERDEAVKAQPENAAEKAEEAPVQDSDETEEPAAEAETKPEPAEETQEQPEKPANNRPGSGGQKKNNKKKK